MNHILIAEDEERLAAFIEKGLRKNGFTTTVVFDGEQALQIVTDKDFQLLLLDLGLPLKDGWTVLKELRNQGLKLPIIIVTAIDDERKLSIAFNLGANDYVTKPFRFGDLLEKVNFYLSHNEVLNS